jgi:hypothetical protein
MRTPARLALLLTAAISCGGSTARAQTMKEELQQHVREGIEKSDEAARKRREEDERKRKQEKQKAAAPEQKPRPRPNAQQTDVPGLQLGFDPHDPLEAPPEPGPQLPLRVLGEHFRLDVTLGAGYRGWLPQQYRAVDVLVGSYATWNIDLKAKIYFLNLRRGYYESNGVAAPRTNEGAVASQVAKYAPKAVKLLGVLGVPINREWEPQIRYESRAFETRALPTKNVCVVDRAASGDVMGCKGSMGELKIISAFETLVAGVRYDHSRSDSPVVGDKAGKIPPIFIGLGLMQYRKPYQLNINGFTLDDYLFDSRFRGLGLALGVELGGGVNNFFAEVDAQLGAGAVSLTDKLSLKSVIPSDYTIGYVQGTATLGYRLALFRGPPTLLLVPVITAGGASFFLVSTNSDNPDATSPAINWDFLWTAQVSLVLPL